MNPAKKNTDAETLPSRAKAHKPTSPAAPPAIVLPVEIMADEHERIAKFCEGRRLSVQEYVTLVGVRDPHDYETDVLVRDELLSAAAARFGSVPKAGEDDGVMGHPLEVSIFQEDDGSLFARFELESEVADELRRQAQEQGGTVKALLWRYITEGVASHKAAAETRRTLNLTFSAAGWAALAFAATDCGHATVEEGAREALRSFTVATLEHYGDGINGEDTAHELFADPARSADEKGGAA